MTHTARTDLLEQLIDDLEDITAALLRALSDADSASTRLHGAWDGEASDAHRSSHRSWREEAGSMADALAQMRSVVRGATANYAAAAAQNSKMWA